ncbi:unnamed protein product [Ranitomeya imitator]|uniref:Uncharacterized protein n=1 Tax=Ranitomeya imitator TaxID=111125 RepID=A0ABN9L6S4_9NEOB|nr:unnamed protein product [Ranitomeya imitator]
METPGTKMATGSFRVLQMYYPVEVGTYDHRWDMWAMKKAMPDSGVFAYTNEDRERILEGVESNATFLSTPSLYDWKVKYENITRKSTTAQLHLVTLSEYYRVKKIPRGLRSNIRPNLMLSDASFYGKFGMISNKYGLDIILLNIEYLQQEMKKLKCDISLVETQLKDLMREEEWNNFKESINIKIDKLRLELEDVKRRKWNRDMDDYKDGNIYNWQRDNAGNWRKKGLDPMKEKNENSRKRGGKKHRRQQKREKREKQVTCRKTDGDKEQENRPNCKHLKCIKLKEWFWNKPNIEKPLNCSLSLQQLNLKKTSHFIPPDNSPVIEAFILAVNHDIEKLKKECTNQFLYPNMTVGEMEALYELAHDDEIIIKNADKGGAVVIMNKKDYIDEINRQLADPEVYERLTHDPKFDIARDIKSILDGALAIQIIDQDVFDFLTVKFPITPVMLHTTKDT